MIEALGIVREVDGDRVLVEVQRRSACGGCASTGSCGTATLGKWFARGTSRLRLHSRLPVRAGETVVIGLEEATLLRASLLLYLLPVVALIAGAVAGAALGGGSDSTAIVGGVLGFGAGLALSRSRVSARSWGTEAGLVLLRRHDEPGNVPLDAGLVRTTTTRSL